MTVYQSIDMSIGIHHTESMHPSVTHLKIASKDGRVFCGHCHVDWWEEYVQAVKEGEKYD